MLFTNIDVARKCVFNACVAVNTYFGLSSNEVYVYWVHVSLYSFLKRTLQSTLQSIEKEIMEQYFVRNLYFFLHYRLDETCK